MRRAGQNPDVLEERDRSPLPGVAVVRVLAVGLLAAVLGVGAGSWLADAEGDEETTPELVAGQVTRQVIPPASDLPLEVPLMNVGSEPVEVLHVQVSETQGQEPSLDPAGPSTPLEPGEWRLLPLHVPEGCRELETASVRLLVRSGGGEPAEVLLPLPSESQALRDQQALACARGSHPTSADLVGLWLLDRDFRRDSSRLTLLFTASGTYRLDIGGDVFAGPVDEGGTYRVDGGLLELRIREGTLSPCEPGERVQLRPHLLDDGRLHVGFPADPDHTCAALRDVDLVFSRIAGPDELPGRAP